MGRAAEAGYNRELVAGYVAAFNAARDEFGLNGEPELNAILRLRVRCKTRTEAKRYDRAAELLERRPRC